MKRYVRGGLVGGAVMFCSLLGFGQGAATTASPAAEPDPSTEPAVEEATPPAPQQHAGPLVYPGSPGQATGNMANQLAAPPSGQQAIPPLDPEFVLLACALVPPESSPKESNLEAWGCDPKLNLLPRSSVIGDDDARIRIFAGHIRIWAAPRSCSKVKRATDLNSQQECLYGVASLPEAAALSKLVKSLKVGDMSFTWMLTENPEATAVTLDVEPIAKALDWDLGKHVVISAELKEDEGFYAYSFTYGWWISGYRQSLSTDYGGLFIPTGLVAIGGSARDTRVAVMPLGVGFGTKFMTWDPKTYVGLAVFTAYSVQADVFEQQPGVESKFHPLGVAVGAMVDLSNILYVGLAALYNAREKDWGHYLVAGSPLTTLFK